MHLRWQELHGLIPYIFRGLTRLFPGACPVLHCHCIDHVHVCRQGRCQRRTVPVHRHWLCRWCGPVCWGRCSVDVHLWIIWYSCEHYGPPSILLPPDLHHLPVSYQDIKWKRSIGLRILVVMLTHWVTVHQKFSGGSVLPHPLCPSWIMSGGRVGCEYHYKVSHLQFVCPVITAICFWNMDTIESRYSVTGALSYDELKVNTWHPLQVWICYKRGSRHPLTAAVHKWSYKSEKTLCLWPRQAYGSGCSCPPNSTSRSWHDKAQDSLAPGGDNQVLHENAEWSRSPRAQGSLLLILGVLWRIGQHGWRYDPSTVKRRERDKLLYCENNRLSLE